MFSFKSIVSFFALRVVSCSRNMLTRTVTIMRKKVFIKFLESYDKKKGYLIKNKSGRLDRILRMATYSYDMVSTPSSKERSFH